MTAPLAIDLAGEIGRGDFRTQIELKAAPGETIVVRGENGSGKTTVLRTIAGLEALATGTLTIGNAPHDRPEQQLFVPANQRPIAMAFQEPRLFSHMTVRQNVEFGATAKQAQQALEATQTDQLAELTPQELSGGQAQRVELARAIARQAPILLVDEPLSAVDSSIRSELRHLIASQSATTIWVTHTENPPGDFQTTVIGKEI